MGRSHLGSVGREGESGECLTLLDSTTDPPTFAYSWAVFSCAGGRFGGFLQRRRAQGALFLNNHGSDAMGSLDDVAFEKNEDSNRCGLDLIQRLFSGGL